MINYIRLRNNLYVHLSTLLLWFWASFLYKITSLLPSSWRCFGNALIEILIGQYLCFANFMTSIDYTLLQINLIMPSHPAPTLGPRLRLSTGALFGRRTLSPSDSKPPSASHIMEGWAPGSQEELMSECEHMPWDCPHSPLQRPRGVFYQGGRKGAAGESDDYFTCILVHKFYSDHLWLWAEHITTYLSEI